MRWWRRKVRTTASTSASPSSLSDEVARLRGAADKALRCGHHDAAIELQGQAALLRPQSSELHRELGVLLRQAGRIEAAREALSRARATAGSADDRRAASNELAALPLPPPGRDNFQVGQVLTSARGSSNGNVQFTVREVHGGAFGAVYVVDQDRDRRVIKTFDAGYLWSDDDRRRFLREAATWVSLDPHPNVVTAATADEIEGFPALVMEYVPGGDLARRLRNGPMDRREALERGMELCSGMTHAWRQLGLVHRDLKPANCLLDAEGTLKVADFGLSRALRGARESALAIPLAAPTAQTLYSTVAGTPAYMAPEQFDVRAELDTRADIYAFGVILYQMLIGELLTPGAAASDLDRLRHRTTLPDPVRQVIRRCVEQDRERRPASFVKVREALATAYADLVGRPAPPVAVSRPVSTWTWIERGIAFRHLGLAAEAVAAVDRGLASVDTETGETARGALWQVRGLALADLDQDEDAIRAYDQALMHTPQEPSTWVSRGAVIANLTRWEEALRDFDQALMLAPDYPGALRNKASALGDLRRFAESNEAFRRARELLPRDVELLTNWANVLVEEGRPDEGLHLVDEALEIAPRFGLAWVRRGKILYNARRLEEALASYERAVEIEPDNAAALRNRVRCLIGLGRLQDAFTACDLLLARHPEDEFATEQRQKLVARQD